MSIKICRFKFALNLARPFCILSFISRNSDTFNWVLSSAVDDVHNELVFEHKFHLGWTYCIFPLFKIGNAMKIFSTSNMLSKPDCESVRMNTGNQMEYITLSKFTTWDVKSQPTLSRIPKKQVKKITPIFSLRFYMLTTPTPTDSKVKSQQRGAHCKQHNQCIQVELKWSQRQRYLVNDSDHITTQSSTHRCNHSTESKPCIIGYSPLPGLPFPLLLHRVAPPQMNITYLINLIGLHGTSSVPSPTMNPVSQLLHVHASRVSANFSCAGCSLFADTICFL